MDKKKVKLSEKKNEMNESGFWDNQELAVEISKEVEDLSSEIEKLEKIKIDIKNILEFNKELLKEKNEALEKEILRDLVNIEKVFSEFEFLALFNGKYDEHSAIISIHAGTGGVDAQDWTEILERMYLRFMEKKGWKVSILDRIVSGEAGIKSVTIQISGKWAYGHLKSEAGVHRLVRISPFDAEGMRHTSFSLVDVMPEFKREEDFEIKSDDLKIDTYRSSGAGGQSVNKVESAVRITHLPTGLVATCQNERSQYQNKESAMSLLRSKLVQKREIDIALEKKDIRGEIVRAEWGKQIRSYVMQPYQMVKDHRTEYETSQIDKVLNGEIGEFIEAYLKL